MKIGKDVKLTLTKILYLNPAVYAIQKKTNDPLWCFKYFGIPNEQVTSPMSICDYLINEKGDGLRIP